MPKPSRRSRRSRQGLTIVETSLLVSVAGVALAIAVPTFLRALQTSKVSEAGLNLQRMVAGAEAYYVAFHEVDGMHRTHCLPATAGPVPGKPSEDGASVNMAVYPDAAATFESLGFALPDPARYRYTFTTTAAGCNLDAVTPPVTVVFTAEGDLDGDGVLSRFSRVATARSEALLVDPLLRIERRVE